MGTGLWQQIKAKLPIKSDVNGKTRYSPWFIAALIVIFIYFMYLSAQPKQQADMKPQEYVIQPQTQATPFLAYKEQLERELEEKLESVRGVQRLKFLLP